MTEKQWNVEFAKKLRRKMDSEGINQRELSRASGLSEASISNYISARQAPKVYALMRIAKVLRSSIYEFIPFDR